MPTCSETPFFAGGVFATFAEKKRMFSVLFRFICLILPEFCNSLCHTFPVHPQRVGMSGDCCVTQTASFRLITASYL